LIAEHVAQFQNEQRMKKIGEIMDIGWMGGDSCPVDTVVIFQMVCVSKTQFRARNSSTVKDAVCAMQTS